MHIVNATSLTYRLQLWLGFGLWRTGHKYRLSSMAGKLPERNNVLNVSNVLNAVALFIALEVCLIKVSKTNVD